MKKRRGAQFQGSKKKARERAYWERRERRERNLKWQKRLEAMSALDRLALGVGRVKL